MAFIATIPEDQASGDVAQMYRENVRPEGYLPNYVRMFGHRPRCLHAWGNLVDSLKHDMDVRRYELVTLAAARALKNSYCMLAHGSVLGQQFYSTEQLTLIARDYHAAGLTAAEVAMMDFAELVVRDAAAITQDDVDNLREHGLSDAEIFEVAATAAARCFFSKTLDALGVEPDEKYLDLDKGLRKSLTVGRPISGEPNV